jgi:hypothetical protein
MSEPSPLTAQATLDLRLPLSSSSSAVEMSMLRGRLDLAHLVIRFVLVIENFNPFALLYLISKASKRQDEWHASLWGDYGVQTALFKRLRI